MESKQIGACIPPPSEVLINHIMQFQVSDLSRLGGSDIATTVRRVMKHIFTPELAKTYNWLGRPPKSAFSKLKLKGVVLGELKSTFYYGCKVVSIVSTNSSNTADAVRKSRSTKDATDFEIEAVIKNWLRMASDANGGRERRRKSDRQ